jgi:transposase
MRATTVLSLILGLKQTRVIAIEFNEVGLVVDVAPMTRIPRCSGCGCRVQRLRDHYDDRQWRHLDLGAMQLTLRYRMRRVDCARCGVRVEMVPWAEHGSAFTTQFEEQVAYLAQRTDKTTISGLMRTAWRTVGRIIERVVARLGPADRLDGLSAIGVDELSYRRHHEYVTVVIDHTTGNVVWSRPGKNADTLNRFFADLGPERSAKLEAVTIDMSKAYVKSVTESAPNARIVFDRFHVQRLAHDALDEVRRAQVRETAGSDEGKAIKKSRFALQKNPWNLNRIELEKVAQVQATNQPLYRAYLLKESLAAILDRRQVNVAEQKLLEWLDWAARSKLAPFVKAGKTIRAHLDGILAYIASGLSNGRAEGTNGKIRTITRRGYGFHNAYSLIGLIFLCCSHLILTPASTYPPVHAR